MDNLTTACVNGREREREIAQPCVLTAMQKDGSVSISGFSGSESWMETRVQVWRDFKFTEQLGRH